MFVTATDDILFIEEALPGEAVIGPVEVYIGGVFTSAQLKSLTDVKKRMAEQAKQLGANCIMHFTYGQRSSLSDLFFNLDDVSWYGRGSAVCLDAARYMDLKPSSTPRSRR